MRYLLVQHSERWLGFVQMERDHAAEFTQGAQEAMGTLRDTYESKKAEAEPHRQQRKELKETAQRTSDKFRCAHVWYFTRPNHFQLTLLYRCSIIVYS